MIIYKATNKINGKCYIGATTGSLTIRKNVHIYQSKSTSKTTHFHNALRKYGKENFEWVIIRYCADILEMNRMETFYIWLYDTIRNGYNIKAGGNNHKMSINTIEKIRKN